MRPRILPYRQGEATSALPGGMVKGQRAAA